MDTENIKNKDWIVILFYKFVNIDNPERLMKEQRKLCESLDLKGRMIIAKEGVNATFEGLRENIEVYKKAFNQGERFKDVVFKESKGNGKAFTKLMIKVRSEIVTLKAGEFDVKNETAPELTAKELEQMYQKDDDFIVLDLRNDFEIDAGYFDKTYNLKLKNFRDLPEEIKKIKDLKDKKIVSVCTGGIRCEKATCLLKREGFENVYQLKDGIHTYMQEFPNRHFRGTLFVFDNRMTTSVVDFENREIVGACIYCSNKSEDFYSDDSVRPSKKVIVCKSCVLDHSQNLRKC